MTSGRGILSVDDCDSASAVHCVVADAATCYFVKLLLEIPLEIQSSSKPLPVFTFHPLFLLPFVVFWASRQIPELGPCPDTFSLSLVGTWPVPCSTVRVRTRHLMYCSFGSNALSEVDYVSILVLRA